MIFVNMWKNKKAFSFIEILVSVSILAIITASGTFYFLSSLGGNQAEQNVRFFENYFSDLDRQIKNHQLYTYKAKFLAGDYFLVDKNNVFGKHWKVVGDFIPETGEITFKHSSAALGFIVREYVWEKFLSQKNSDYTFSMNGENEKTFVFFDGDEYLNEITVKQYSFHDEYILSLESTSCSTHDKLSRENKNNSIIYSCNNVPRTSAVYINFLWEGDVEKRVVWE